MYYEPLTREILTRVIDILSILQQAKSLSGTADTGTLPAQQAAALALPKIYSAVAL